VFQGASSLILDGKGRLTVPSRHRDVFNAVAAGQLTITKNPDGYLMIFPRPEWEKTRERIAAMPQDAQWWQRSLLGRAMDVEIDGTGRVLISPELRQSAGIVRDVELFGVGNHLELWDRALHAELEAKATQAVRPESVRNFSFRGN
jgi:MraZ protein